MAVRPMSQSGSLTAAARLRLQDAARLRRYKRMLDAYEGRHFERPRTGRSSLVLNYAKPVVDKGVAYLLGRGLGFSVPPRRQGSKRDQDRAKRAEQLLYDVYWDNDLEATDLQVAQNAGVLGDGVYKVWWDVLAAQIRVACVDPFSFFARFAGDDPSELVRVEVAYALGPEELADGGYVADLATARALVGSAETAEVVERWTSAELEVLVADRQVRHSPNPYGWVPFVQHSNLTLSENRIPARICAAVWGAFNGRQHFSAVINGSHAWPHADRYELRAASAS